MKNGIFFYSEPIFLDEPVWLSGFFMPDHRLILKARKSIIKKIFEDEYEELLKHFLILKDLENSVDHYKLNTGR